MSKKNNRANPPKPPVTPIDGVLLALPVVFVLGVRTVAGPCIHEDGTVGACAMAGTVLTGLGVVAAVLAALRLYGADKRTRRSFDLFLVIAGLAMAILPGNVLQLCMMATMHCRAVMLPFARIMGVALVLLAVACEFTVDRDIPTGRKRRR